MPSALHGRDVFMYGNDYSKTEVSQNCYMYCMSLELSAEAAGHYDACVEIVDPENFLNAITEHLTKLLGVPLQRQSRPVVYGSREQDYPGDRSIPVVFLKDKDPYEVEREVRAIWIPMRPTPMEPITVTVPGVIEWLRPAAVPGRQARAAPNDDEGVQPRSRSPYPDQDG